MFQRLRDLLARAHDAMGQIETDPRIQAELTRIKSLPGFDPTSLITLIMGIVTAFFQGGGAGGIQALIDLVLGFLKGYQPKPSA